VFVCAVGTAGGIPVIGASAPSFSSTNEATLVTSTGSLCAGITIASGARATVGASIGGRSATLDVIGPL